jgi:hypothetical protein
MNKENFNEEYLASSKRCAEYIYNSDDNLESYRNWIIDGQNPKEHIFYDAARVLNKDNELDIDIQEYEQDDEAKH